MAAVGKQGRLTVSGLTTPDTVAQLDELNVEVQSDLSDEKLRIEDAFIAHLVTDRPDGLYTTVVVDEQGVSIGLVYSSKESISEAIKLKRGVYYSRSRKSIWYKGDTSGDTQKLIKIELDCDRDALKFVVGQDGDGFCHLKSRSCFSRNDAGLGGLMRVLESRRKAAPAGSYTKRLFEDADLLRAKLVEEANELADAKTKEEVTGETADVIYFALVAAAKAGVSLADVERELDRRSLKVQRRPGDSKPHIVSLLQEQDKLKQQKAQEQKAQAPVEASSQIMTQITSSAQENGATISPERPLHIDTPKAQSLVKLALPKGRMEGGVFKLINDAGLALKVESRGYRPTMAIPNFDVKLLKPQNIVEMVNLGQRDIGFTGADLVEELGAKNVTMVLNTQLDKVKIVAAAPEDILDENGEVLKSISSARKLVVASEYKNIAQRWMAKKGLTQENSLFVLSRGATEVFPPEDADIIVDNTATGSTLKANRLRPFDELLHSTTCMFVNTTLWNATDEVSRQKQQVIKTLVVLLQSVLDAQRKVILEFNVEQPKLEEVCKFIPAMREPTISQLHGSKGFAVKSVVPRDQLFNLIPLIKSHGGSDIIVTDLHHVVL